MTLSYHNLDIKIPLEGIVHIESLQLVQRLNEHGRVQIKALVEEEMAVGLIEQANSSLCVHISRNDDKRQTIFQGCAERAHVKKEEGLFYLYMDFYGYTRKWDLTDKSQSFCKGNDTYAQVLQKVLSEYGQKEIRDEASGGSKIPGMLMQYEETDWAFLKRLASHFSTFLMTDNTQDFGKAYFGIPKMDHGTVLTEEEYTVLKGKERYEKLEEAGDILSQEMMGWRIRSRKHLQFGEQVMLGHIETVVTGVDIRTQEGELVFEYELSRRKGILCAKKKNPKIYGMSIPATVKERKGNQIRVRMDIDPSYEASDDLKWFTYAIETSNFYCMPEEGSRVHIYFPDHDEQSAMAVHALRTGGSAGNSAGGNRQGNDSSGGNASGGSSSESGHSGNGGSSGGDVSGGAAAGAAAAGAAASVGMAAAVAASMAGQEAAEEAAEKDPAYKKFSDPSGSYMELAPYGITFSPGSGSVAMTLQKSGTLSITGKTMSFLGNAGVYAGRGKGGAIPEAYFCAQKELKLTLGSGDSQIDLKEEANIVSTFIKKEAKIKRKAMPSAAGVRSKLTAGDEALRAEYSAGAKQNLTDYANQVKAEKEAVLARKEAEAKKQIRGGIVSLLTVVGSVALVVATGGAAAPLVAAMAVTGGFKAVSAVADIAEGVSDLNKAKNGDLSPSYNFMRDGVFRGNETLYEAAKGVNDFVFGMVTGKAIKGNILDSKKTGKVLNFLRKGYEVYDKNKGAKYLMDATGDAVMSSVNEFVETGSVSPKNFGANLAAGFVKGWGLENVRIGCGSEMFKNHNLARKALNTIGGTGMGTGVDWVKSKYTGEPFDLGESLKQNAILAGFSNMFGEPIEAASGAFLITATDLYLPDILEPVSLSRSYSSTRKECGWLGRGWRFSWEGKLCVDGDTLHVQLPDGYCIAFEMEESETEPCGCAFRDRIGNGRYGLALDYLTGECQITDTHRHRVYRYGEKGLLQSVTDKNGNRLTLAYRDGFPEKMTTALGYEVSFVFEDGRLVKLTDSAGRTLQYRYEGESLTEVVHMDGGVTRYAYSEEGFLIRPTDQTGLSYLENRYDEKGRVTLQTLANGDTYRARYLDRQRQVFVEYSAYPGEKRYTCNQSMEVEEILYPDGSTEQFAYDIWHNRVEETDRLGRTTKKEYDASGHLIRESRPGGLVTEHIYDENGDLESICDNAGRQRRFIYDANHNLISKQEKISENRWTAKTYRYDRMGRLIQECDGEGHATEYRYEEKSSYPYCTIYADGTEVHSEYDNIGRRMADEDSVGRTEYGYNRGNYQTMVRDGEGNETHFFYDGMGRMLALYTPVQWKDKGRNHTSYRYDFLDRLTDTVYPDGSHEKLFRDGEGNILKKVHPNAYEEKTGNGEGVTYDYDGDNHLVRIHYPDGGTERFFYDAAGNRIKHVLPEQYESDADDGAGWTYTYDISDRLTSVTGPDGVQETAYVYDPWGNCVQKTNEKGIITYYAYDLTGKPVRKLEPFGTDAENVRYCQTIYEYDDNGNKVKETRCGGSYREDGTLTEPGEDLVLTFAYDARNRLVRAEDGTGAKVCYQYDVRGNRISEEQAIHENVKRRILYTYNKAGRPVKKTEILDSGLLEDAGAVPQTAVTCYTYDENGNRTGIITPEGYQISRSYDSRDRLVAERVEDQKNGIDRTTCISYDRAGNIISVRQQGTDGKAREVSYGYDLKDRLTRIAELDGPVAEAAYDGNDRIKERRSLLPADAEAYGKAVYAYDLRGNLTKQYRTDGILGQQNQYDLHGNRIRTVDGDGVEVHYRYGLQDEQRAVFTQNSRLQKKAVQKLVYNARGQITGIEDGCGGRTGFDLDHWGRITSVHTAEGGKEAYAYDYAGNIIETVDAKGGRIRYAYNSQGKVCAITDQSGNTETFRYDREGRQTAHTDRNGTLTQTSYNADGNRTMQVCTDREGNRRIMGSWEYDSFGQLKKAVAGGFVYTYEYRPDGKLLKKWSSGRLVVSCTYYRDGSIRSLTDVTGRTTRYGYDSNGRLAMLQDEEGNILTEYTYTSAGRVKEIRTPGGMEASYSYDCDGNLIRLRLGKQGKENLLYDARMSYDLNGNRTGRRGFRLSADGRRQEMETAYSYDAMNRLTQENRGKTGEKYAYDLNGNRLKKEHFKNGIVDAAEVCCYNERNELTQKSDASGLVSYLYDANGNLLSERTKKEASEYRYDLLNRQTCVHTLTGQEQENRYDGEGLRAGIAENGKASYFQFHNGEILTECDGESMPIRRHISGMDLSCVQTLDDNAYHIYHRDEQGSTAYITDQCGSVENSYLYDAYGNVLESREIIQNRMLYTGQQYDQVTGQYYLRARYYNPVMGRFTQEDTYRSDGLNLYAYCANNPVVYYDPSGHQPATNACGKGSAEEPKKDPAQVVSEGVEGGSTSKNVFPDNPDDLLPEIPRNKVTKANGTTSQTIQTSDSIRIRAEQHPLLPGETYNPRHHGVHYHVEYKVDPTKSWNNKNNVKKWYPNGYTLGAGSGFIPGEAFPG